MCSVRGEKLKYSYIIELDPHSFFFFTSVMPWKPKEHIYVFSDHFHESITEIVFFCAMFWSSNFSKLFSNQNFPFHGRKICHIIISHNFLLALYLLRVLVKWWWWIISQRDMTDLYLNKICPFKTNASLQEWLQTYLISIFLKATKSQWSTFSTERGKRNQRHDFILTKIYCIL